MTLLLLVVRPLMSSPEWWTWENFDTLLTSALVWICIILWGIVLYKKH